MWYEILADRIRVLLVNADRMMMSVLPEPDTDGRLPSWASLLRDGDRSWMAVAQQGVQAFVSHAMGAKVPFATETVFSHWQDLGGGRFASKLDLIRNMQEAGYFVLLVFVGLRDAELSILRVRTRVLRGGHGIAEGTLRARFPRTQRAIAEAVKIADASVLVDNSRGIAQAFTVCRVQLGAAEMYDTRTGGDVPGMISAWLPIISP